MTGARLIPVQVPRDPRGVVLVLHGGAARRGESRVSPAQLSVLRMIPIARGIARAGHRRLAVYRLLNTHRGWDTRHTPVADARWALAAIRAKLGQRPTCLVGHSLGGRAALLAAGEPGVTSAVALAPWVYPDDQVDAPGRRLLIVHGRRDRIAKPSSSAAVARRLAAQPGTEVGYRLVDGGKHAMLRHHRDFTGPAIAFAVATTAGGQDQELLVEQLLRAGEDP